MRASPLAALAVLLLAACGSQAPSLPEIDAASFPANAQGHVRQALATLDDSPGDPAANGRLGMLLHAHDRHGEALLCYRRAAHFAPEEPRWLYLQGQAQMSAGDAQAAIESWQAALALGANAPTLIHLGNAFEALGRREDARKAFEDALQLDPEAPAALHGLARVLSAEGAHAEAIPLLEKAVEIAPSAGAVYYALGIALRDSGKDQPSRQALAMAERYQRAQPPVDDPVLREVQALRRDPNWLLNEGRRLESQGDIQRAAALYQEAIDQQPDFVPALSNLVAALGYLGRYHDAEKHYRHALEIAPNLEELHYNWGIVEAERGNLEAAAQSFRTALELNPDSADTHFNLGSMLAQLGLEADAVREMQRTLELDPYHRLALFQLAGRSVQAGRLNEGIAMLERALDAPVDARTAGVLYALADAHARAGDMERAVLHARQALELARELGDAEMAAAIERDLRELGADR